MGTSDTEFAPDASVTRGMAITIIYRLEKEPEAVGTPFVDVAADAWYAKAAAWGFENKVVGGVGDNKFAPDREITREQMAVMLYNYNNEISLNDVSFEITSYEDADKVSSWALSAMKWAVANKLINGKTADTLAPQDTLTRAEMATILKRFIEYKAK